jgi:hypothetical protein
MHRERVQAIKLLSRQEWRKPALHKLSARPSALTALRLRGAASPPERRSRYG